MPSIEIISETPISMIELKDKLNEIKKRDNELTPRANKTLDYLNQFSKTKIGDFNKLKEYSIKYSLSMIRKIGFLLDQIDVDTTDLLILSESNKKSHSKLTKDSHLYNAKWRLYYDSNLT